MSAFQLSHSIAPSFSSIIFCTLCLSAYDFSKCYLGLLFWNLIIFFNLDYMKWQSGCAVQCTDYTNVQLEGCMQPTFFKGRFISPEYKRLNRMVVSTFCATSSHSHSSPKRGSRSQKEECTHGRHLEIGDDISWTTSLWSIDSETVCRMCRHCLRQKLTLTTTYWLPKSAPGWRKL